MDSADVSPPRAVGPSTAAASSSTDVAESVPTSAPAPGPAKAVSVASSGESPPTAGGDLSEFIDGPVDADEWPEAVVITSKAMTSSGQSWPPAQVVPSAAACSSSGGYPAAAPAMQTSTPGASSSSAVPAEACASDGSEPPGGLRRFIADLSLQLAEEVKRREIEEEELERRAAEKRRLLEELESLRKRRERLLIEQRNDEEAAADIEKRHSELAEDHQALRAEVAKKEAELEKLREEAKARTGSGREWARDGPEKDALVETKLKIAEAHDELAQLRQQLWLNREGLKRQLADLQAENMRLRTGRSVASS